MRTRRAAAVLLLLASILALTGCWDARELDTLSIVAGVGIDASGTQGEYDFTVEVGKAQKSKSGGDNNSKSAPYMLLTATDKTMLLAMQQFRFKNSRELFLHPNQVIIFGQELAAQGLGPVLDMFIRDHESRLEVWAFVADGTAGDILSVETKQEPIPAAAVARLMENASGISKYYGTKMIELFSRLADKGTSTVIPIIKKIEEPDNTGLALSGCAVFNNDKMVGTLSEDETQGYIFAMGDVEDGLLEVPMPEGTAVLEISNLSAKASPMLKDGRITIKLTVNALLAIGELQGFKKKKMDELMPQIEKAAADKIVKEIAGTFVKTQLLKTDIYGYGLSIYKKYPKEWEKMKDDWDNIYAGIELQLKVKTQLSNVGLIVDSLEMRGAK